MPALMANWPYDLIFKKEKEWFPLENKANYEMNQTILEVFLFLLKHLSQYLLLGKLFFPMKCLELLSS